MKSDCGHQKTMSGLFLRKYLQLPNLRGQEWPSMGKSMRFIGHSALIVSLIEKEYTQK